MFDTVGQSYRAFNNQETLCAHVEFYILNKLIFLSHKVENNRKVWNKKETILLQFFCPHFIVGQFGGGVKSDLEKAVRIVVDKAHQT